MDPSRLRSSKPLLFLTVASNQHDQSYENQTSSQQDARGPRQGAKYHLSSAFLPRKKEGGIHTTRHRAPRGFSGRPYRLSGEKSSRGDRKACPSRTPYSRRPLTYRDSGGLSAENPTRSRPEFRGDERSPRKWSPYPRPAGKGICEKAGNSNSMTSPAKGAPRLTRGLNGQILDYPELGITS